MGKYFIGLETIRVAFDDGEYVDIKEEFTQADIDYITAKMMQASVTPAKNGNAPDAQLNLVLGKQATLERAIISWSFSEDGKAVPVTPDNISNLRSRYRSKVLVEIDRLSEQMNRFAKN